MSKQTAQAHKAGHSVGPTSLRLSLGCRGLRSKGQSPSRITGTGFPVRNEDSPGCPEYLCFCPPPTQGSRGLGMAVTRLEDTIKSTWKLWASENLAKASQKYNQSPLSWLGHPGGGGRHGAAQVGASCSARPGLILSWRRSAIGLPRASRLPRPWGEGRARPQGKTTGRGPRARRPRRP